MNYSETIKTMVWVFLKDREMPFAYGKENFYIGYNHKIPSNPWVVCIDRFIENPFQVYVTEQTIKSLHEKFGLSLKLILPSNQ